MSSAEVIDALFERTIDIVQSLPKSGPIQTSYEEKLSLYSLYKQATEGDVNAKRPSMLDMLGRAKWDAWAKRKGYSSQDAKQLYVESMLKTLRRFSDRAEAIALIEELESFSGDVAQRVMSASLARAGSETDETSEEENMPRTTSQRFHTRQGGPLLERAEEEDERDRVSQLPLRPPTSSRPSSSQAQRGDPSRYLGGSRTPMSVEGASAMAVRGAGGPSSQLLEETDSEDEESPPSRAPITSRNAPQYLAQQGRGTSVGRGPGPQYGRGGPSSLPNEPRLYAPPGPQRYAAPSDSNFGGQGVIRTGGAGASLYSAIGPSRPPAATSEQHYYHHHGQEGGGATPSAHRAYAPSSIGGRSNPGGRGQRPEVELALQSIQASLAGLHERLNRVERTPSVSLTSVLFGSRSPLGLAYRAFSNATHDIAMLIGIARDDAGRRGAAPSSYQLSKREDGRSESVGGRSAGSKRHAGQGAGGANGRGGSSGSPLLKLLLTFINLSFRLALDLTSVTVVLSLFLLLIRRVTGKGDPLLLIRLIRRYSGIDLLTRRQKKVQQIEQ